MKSQVKQWLESGTIDIFLGMKMVDGHPLPHAFTLRNLSDLEDLVPGTVRSPLEKFAAELAAANPDARIGLAARECTQRALNVLSLWNQAPTDRIETIKLNCCPSPLKEHAVCSYLDPPEAGLFKKHFGIDNAADPEAVARFEPRERFSRWMYEFQKCIKCYGCRNICPVCFCEDCSLEHEDLIGTGQLPPEAPIFHLVRAVHMAGRCIDCGLCEEACPADIPLRLLYRKVNAVVDDLFDYRAGEGEQPPPFTIIGERPSLAPKPMENGSACPQS